MSRYLAVEWDQSEVRLAAAASGAGGTVIERAVSIPRGPVAGGDRNADQGPPEEELGERIRQALAGIGRADTLVAVGRASVELRQLSVPPAPAEELPDMVRFQALREFNAMEENWLLDFVPLQLESDEEQAVLAAAMSPETFHQIQGACQAAGLKPRRMILRPFGAASLVRRSRPDLANGVRLLVDLLEDESDLTAVADGQVVFLRTARLPGDPLASAEAAGALVAEIRRTVAAVRNQMGGRAVDSIVLFGAGDPYLALAEKVHEQLERPCESFDPLSGLRLGRAVEKDPPAHPGRFAPLLGMLLDEAEERPPATDFLHPRRPPEPPSRRNLYAGIGLAVALVVLVGLGWGWLHAQSLRQDIKRLAAQANRLDKDVARATKLVQAAKAIRQWTEQQTVWLDELRWLSEHFPPAEDAMLVNLELAPGRGRPQMDMEGLARDTAALQAMDRALGDQRHRVVGEGAG
ncbi:MAG TPA: hypothetical protein EYP56_16930, partial [Planctomycetaceae bacterium]|nr:hypothetical protein [Planctomycetaceae bacterium]